MRQYDIAVGMGVGCGVSISMRDAGAQYLSLPFDWIGCNDPVRLAGIAADHFRDWMRLEDLEIQGVRIASQSATFVVANRRTGLLAPHDFPANSSLEKQYPAFAEKMSRRIARLEGALSSAKAVLLVIVENPQRPGCLADADLERTRGILAAAAQKSKLPGAKIAAAALKAGAKRTVAARPEPDRLKLPEDSMNMFESPTYTWHLKDSEGKVTELKGGIVRA